MIIEILILILIIIIATILLKFASRASPDAKKGGGGRLYSGKIVNDSREEGKRYQSWKSDSQVAEVASSGGVVEFSRLIKLLLKYSDAPRKKLVEMILNRRKDSEIYSNLRELSSRNEEMRSKMQARAIYRYFSRMVPRSFRPKKYLDIGCGDGLITKFMAGYFGLKSADCVEIKPPSGVEQVDFATDTSKFGDESFDVVTAVMALHHVSDLDKMVSEISRVMKPGGYLLIKEHDCWDAADAMLVDIEHAIFVSRLERTDPKTQDDLVARYKNVAGWRAAIENHGLSLVRYEFFYPGDKKFEVSATRAFIGVFRKK
jgi:SAM-dependent methyltransferase